MDELGKVIQAHEFSGKLYPRPKVRCTECHELGSLCWGPQKRPHFRHTNSNRTCTHNPGDQYVHNFCRNILCEYLNQGRKVMCKRVCMVCDNVDHVQLMAKKFDVEMKCGNSRLDIGGVDDKNDIVCCVEIYNKHRTYNVHDRNNILWAEVRVEQILDCLYATETEEITLDDVRDWYCNACDQYNTSKWTRETYEIAAKKLWYLVEPNCRYAYRCLLVRDIAIQGKYRKEVAQTKEEWTTVCEDFDDESQEKKTLRKTLICGGKCIRCLIPCDVTWAKVFCIGCYRDVKSRERMIEDAWETWISVPSRVKMEYRRRLQWIGNLPNITDRDYSCVYCANAIDSQDLWNTWWFGLHKRICVECMDDQFTKRKITWAP